MGCGYYESATYLYSRYTVVVIGRYTTVLQWKEIHMEVNGFSYQVPTMHKFTIMYSVMAYDDHISLKMYICVMRIV